MIRKFLRTTAEFPLALIIAALLCAGAAAPSAPPADWDQVFTRSYGWTGGDVAATVPLPGRRVLWLFGDSWIGQVRDGRRVNSTLVNNAIAVHPVSPRDPDRPPTPESIQFFWGPTDPDGKPTAWVRPTGAPADEWFWPTGGGVTVPGPSGVRLALFLLRIRRDAGPGAFGFDCTGSVLALVDGVAGPVKKWRTRLVELPHESALPLTPGEEIDWGAAALFATDAAVSRSARRPAGGGWVYVYGTRADAGNHRDLILARVRPARVGDFDAWEFRQGDEWAEEPDLASAIVSDVASELSVERKDGACGWAAACYLMVSSEPRLGGGILLRRAPAPEGPWSAPETVFTVPQADRSGRRFAYAAHGHAALSAPGSLLVSWIVNSNDLAEIVNDARLYRPRFITVPLQ